MGRRLKKHSREMAMASLRSGSALLRTAARGGSRAPVAPKRTFSSSATHDDAYEMAKWQKITFLGATICFLFGAYTLSKGHKHYEEPPPYPYLNIRNKEFPWGPDSLFSSKKHDH